VEVELLDTIVDGLVRAVSVRDVRMGIVEVLTFCPMHTDTFSSSTPDTNCERLL
jgi:hypothetical protein